MSDTHVDSMTDDHMCVYNSQPAEISQYPLLSFFHI